jgi:UDPglucose 6-dehydrogenase
MTEWNEYRALDLARMRGIMAEPVFIDLRNVYTPEIMAAKGFSYHSVGRTPHVEH